MVILRQNFTKNDSEVSKYVPEIEFLVTHCMMSKSIEIRLETYSTILGLVTVIYLILLLIIIALSDLLSLVKKN